REDVACLFSAYDIIGLTSLSEGTPLSILEAMAAGRPVISTLVGGVSDLFGDEVETISNLPLRQRGVGVPSRAARAFA
ncbi:glycosyltransferase, partial [Escherichia coli]|nr:glycosyltransferase [Escherichia coli]